MANYCIVDSFLGAPSPVSVVDTVQRWPLGYQARGSDLGAHSTGTVANPTGIGAGQFIYCQGSDASQGAWVAYSGYTAKQASTGQTASVFPVGVAAGALSATNLYGWVQVQGLVDNAKCTNANIAVGVPLYLGSAAGRVNSTQSATGFRIVGAALYVAVTATANQTDAVSAHLDYPKYIGATALL